jgi:lipoate-protein ligase B
LLVAELPILEVLRKGHLPYARAHELQLELVDARLRGDCPDTLILCEHEAVITLGRGSRERSVLVSEWPVLEVERGGEATFHGPGQIVAYPILALPEGRRDLHRYLRDLEDVVIRVLEEVEVTGSRRPGATGVWVDDKKVCSIGVAVRRWVTWHGFALNLDIDLKAYRAIRPCGLAPDVMANVSDYMELAPARLLFEVLIVKHLLDVFGMRLPDPPRPSPGPGLPIFPGR